LRAKNLRHDSRKRNCYNCVVCIYVCIYIYTHTHTPKMCSVIFSISYNNIKKNRRKEIGCSRLFVRESVSKQCHVSHYINVQPTPWSRVLFEKLTVPQLVTKFPAFCGTRKFITAFTSARHLSLSTARLIKSMLPHSNY
jgi:hypothetical protein